MVVSVFAGTVALTGTAAAKTANPTLEPNSVSPGAQPIEYNHNATVRVGAAQDRSLQTIVVETRGSLDNVDSSDFSIEVNGTADDGQYGTFSKSGGTLTVVLQNPITVTSDSRVNVTVADATAPAQEGTYDFRTTLRDTSDNRIDRWSNSLEVSAGATTDPDPPLEKFDDYDRNFTSNDNAWVGQRLRFENATSSDYVLGPGTDTDDDGTTDTRDGVSQELSFDKRQTVISTSGLDAGKYVISADGSKTLVTVASNGTETSQNTETNDGEEEAITLNEQSLDASVREDSVPKGEQFTLDVSSERSGYLLTVSSSDLSDSQIEDIFGDDRNAEYDGVQVRVTNAEDAITGTADVESGNYTFDFDVADTPASDSDTLTVGSAEDRQAELAETFTRDQRGDVATFTLNLTNTQKAALVVGDADSVNYETTVSVRDRDEDGQVTIEMNTFTAGKVSQSVEQTPGRVYSVGSGDDIVAIDREQGTPSELEAADYPLSAQVSGQETGIGTLILEEREMSGTQAWTAPASANLGDYQDLATQDQTTAKNDWAVVQFNASGLEGYLNDTTQFNADGYNASTGISITLAATGDINKRGAGFTPDDDEVVMDYDLENDTMYMLVDTESESIDQKEYTARLKINETNPYVEDTGPSEQAENLSQEFSVVERTASFDTQDGEVIVRSAEDQEISGTTTVADNTEFTIRASTTGDRAFLLSDSATVEDGEFSVSLDFSDVETNTTFTASIPGQDLSDNARTPGRVRAPPTATVSISDQSGGDTIVVDSAELSDGGFVTIHDSSLSESPFDSVRGTSTYLAAGSETDISITLDDPYESSGTAIAMPHLDTNGNQQYDFVSSEGGEDGPYTDDGGNIVTDSASVTVETPTATPTETVTPTTPATATATATATEPGDMGTPTDTQTQTDSEQPGFGLIVALLALIAAALIAVRRD